METIVIHKPSDIVQDPDKESSFGIFDDKEYLEEYFKICELLQRKRAFLNFKEETGDISKKVTDSQIEKNTLKKKIDLLNFVIKEKEKIFWSRVEASLLKGEKFAFEETALSFQLDRFEKRVLLFFLYLEFFHLSQNICFEDEILKIFDLEDSVFDRIRNFAYVSNAGRLISNPILCKEFTVANTSATATLSLSSFFLELFSVKLSGKNPSIKVKKKKEVPTCTDVGFVKDPEYKIQDVKLKSEVKDKVLFYLDSIKCNKFKELGVEKKIKRSSGASFLFYGAPGTGKSMLAEAIADYLKKKLLIVEYSKITSRWYGDTDKNISKIFDIAKNNNHVLCLDEADSLLYNRNFAAREHDIRFVNEMLIELERFDGIVILTTNMDALLDQALERRISLRVKFELPDEKIREQIWKNHIPASFKISEDVDFSILAKRYSFAGGYIRNAVLNTLRWATMKNKYILTMDDFLFGANMENEGIFNKENHKINLGFAMQ